MNRGNLSEKTIVTRLNARIHSQREQLAHKEFALRQAKRSIAELVEVVEEAIRSGDWKVDGACDPVGALHRARHLIAQGIEARSGETRSGSIRRTKARSRSDAPKGGSDAH